MGKDSAVGHVRLTGSVVNLVSYPNAVYGHHTFWSTWYCPSVPFRAVILMVCSSDVLRHCLMAVPHVPLLDWEIQQSFDVPGIRLLH